MAEVESGERWNGEKPGKPGKPVDVASPDLNLLNLLRFLTPSEAPFSPAIRPLAERNDQEDRYGESRAGADYFLTLPSLSDKDGATVRTPDGSEIWQFRLSRNQHAFEPRSHSRDAVDYFLAIPSPFDEHGVTVRTVRRPDGSEVKQLTLPGNEHAVDETPNQ